MPFAQQRKPRRNARALPPAAAQKITSDPNWVMVFDTNGDEKIQLKESPSRACWPLAHTILYCLSVEDSPRSDKEPGAGSR